MKPPLQETDLMDDLDTPFHNDVEDSSFISHKQSILSPDQFPENWSIDCIEEFSRRNGLFDSQCNQTVEKVSVSTYSYSETNIARISGDCAIATASSNSASKENSNEPADCHIPSHVFEYRGNKGDSLRTKYEDSKQNTNFHSLEQVPDLQTLYTDKIEQMERDVSSIGTSHPQLESQSPHQRIQQNSIQASMYQDENSNGKCIIHTCFLFLVLILWSNRSSLFLL